MTVTGTRLTPSVLRSPMVDDAPRILELVRASTLDENSLYHYLLWCRDFAATSVVAEFNGIVTGFVTGYLRPDEPGTWFSWQAAVSKDHPEPGLAGRLFIEAVRRAHDQGARVLEATVNPGNRSVIMLLRKLAASLDAPLDISTLFSADAFDDGHDAEILYRIGPWR